MKRRDCESCGAPLPAVEPGEAVECAHCGTEFRAPEAPSVWVPLFGVGCVVTLIVGGVVSLAGIASFSKPDVVVNVPAGLPKTSDGLPVSRAPELNGLMGWTPMEAPGMQGTYADFPVFDNLDWLHGIGKAWATDVRLTRLGIEGVRADGSLDVSAATGWEVDARYASPTLRTSAAEQRKVSSDKVKSEFRLWVEEGEVKAMVGSAHDPEDAVPPAPELGCTLSELMEAFRAAGLAQRPAYDLTLMYSTSQAMWRWHIDATDPHDDVDGSVLNAATCAPR